MVHPESENHSLQPSHLPLSIPDERLGSSQAGAMILASPALLTTLCFNIIPFFSLLPLHNTFPFIHPALLIFINPKASWALATHDFNVYIFGR